MITEATNKSEGKCLFCGKIYTKTGISRHLQTHLKQKVQENKRGQSYLIKVEPHPRWDALPYFLSLWVDGSATMNDVDIFLRAIWLECCGHMSSFTLPQNRRHYDMLTFIESQNLLKQGKYDEYDKLMEANAKTIAMSRQVTEILRKELKVNYEYDFGSTTELLLTVIEEYPVEADKMIVLLSRNEPLKLLCDTCKTQPATQLCTAHGWDGDQMFCDKCAEKHAEICEDFSEYASLPVVNSPRMSVCCYSGGRIDTERDGVFSIMHN
ncbi:MAG: hypothetical protein LBP72_05465 [Dysgonamonadaceae bacterium]|jgi:hypothetical protein|nr:hypothetical protein [Dysgonamonadaceae bacterium]